MKFLTIFATVFYGGTVWVGADYYIEFREPTAGASSSRSRKQPVTDMTNYLYECKADPLGATAFTAARSVCTPVATFEEKVIIHATCTFYSVYGVNLQGHVIHLSDRGIMPNIQWMLGYSNQAIDHPNFGDPNPEAVGHLRVRIEAMRVGNIVPYYLAHSLVLYFAQTNLIAFSRDAVFANSELASFTTFLERVMDKYDAIDEETNTMFVTTLRRQLTLAMDLALQKMIDPCSVLSGNLQRFASQYCATYCNFLSFVARHLGTAASKCSSLQGGQCAGVACNCVRISSNRFAGCQNSPMHQCNNVMRANLYRNAVQTYSLTGPMFQ